MLREIINKLYMQGVSPEDSHELRVEKRVSVYGACWITSLASLYCLFIYIWSVSPYRYTNVVSSLVLSFIFAGLLLLYSCSGWHVPIRWFTTLVAIAFPLVHSLSHGCNALVLNGGSMFMFVVPSTSAFLLAGGSRSQMLHYVLALHGVVFTLLHLLEYVTNEGTLAKEYDINFQCPTQPNSLPTVETHMVGNATLCLMGLGSSLMCINIFQKATESRQKHLHEAYTLAVHLARLVNTDSKSELPALLKDYENLGELEKYAGGLVEQLQLCLPQKKPIPLIPDFIPATPKISLPSAPPKLRTAQTYVLFLLGLSYDVLETMIHKLLQAPDPRLYGIGSPVWAMARTVQYYGLFRLDTYLTQRLPKLFRGLPRYIIFPTIFTGMEWALFHVGQLYKGTQDIPNLTNYSIWFSFGLLYSVIFSGLRKLVVTTDKPSYYLPSVIRVLFYGMHGFLYEIFFTFMFANVLNECGNRWYCLGHTSFWSFWIYASAAYIYENAYLWHCLRPNNKWLKVTFNLFYIYVFEFVWGYCLRQFNACSWDYHHYPLNLMGLITLVYAPGWSMICYYQDKLMPRYMHVRAEEKQ